MHGVLRTARLAGAFACGVAVLLLAGHGPLRAQRAADGEAGPAQAPSIKRENIEWVDAWITHGTESDLPRVLLVGDSITRAYYPEVEQRLEGQAYVGRLATSKSLGDPVLLDETAAVLKQYRFDVIHFNNGMHGWDYTEDEYARALPDWLATIRAGAPGARLIWATTTPVRERDTLALAPRTERVRARNRIGLAIAQRAGLPVDDLFALVVDRPEFSAADGVHASPAGRAAQAAQVAASIEAVLQR